MSEYTPMTAQIRDCYIGTRYEQNTGQSREEFYRWLAQHDDEVRAEAYSRLGESLATITRVTVVTDEGRAYESAYDAFDGVEIHFQDDGRTLKVLPARRDTTDD